MWSRLLPLVLTALLSPLCRAQLLTGGAPSATSDTIDTFFFSDPHVGDDGVTWDAVEAAFANFRKENPNAKYLVYGGDTIRHGNYPAHQEADVYISKLLALAFKYGFSKENVWVTQGNNDGPHDHPHSPKWAHAVVESGIVPEAEKATCLDGSHYAKCSADICGLVVNTDLEVYGKGEDGTDDHVDKYTFRGNLTDAEIHSFFKKQSAQKVWADAKAEEFMKSGKRFFVLGHHPSGIHKFFDGSWQSKGFVGAFAGHKHTFGPTKDMVTVLPGYLMEGKDHGYAQQAVTHEVNMHDDALVHYDYHKKCFYEDGRSCGNTDGDATLVV